MTVDEKLDSITQRLDRLDLIESHLLDILVPQRKAYQRQPQSAPPDVLATAVKDIQSQVKALSADFGVLRKQILAMVQPTPVDKKEVGWDG